MSTQYDQQYLGLKKQGEEAKQKIQSLQAAVAGHKQEKLQINGEINRLNEEKKRLQQLAMQEAGIDSSREGLEDRMSGDSDSKRSMIQKQIAEVESKINGLASKGRNLEEKISGIQSRDIPEAEGRLSQAVNGLGSLEKIVRADTENYSATYRGVKSEAGRNYHDSSVKSDVNQAAETARKYEQKYKTLLQDIRETLRTVSSGQSSSSSYNGSFSGQYHTNVNPAKSYAWSGNSIDELVNDSYRFDHEKRDIGHDVPYRNYPQDYFGEGVQKKYSVSLGKWNYR